MGRVMRRQARVRRVDDAELTWISDLNFAESLREQARWSAGGESADHRGATFAASATRLPAGPFNAAIATTAEAPEDLLARARAWFGARDRGFTVYVRGRRDDALAERCRDEGMAKMGDMPGMVLEAAPAGADGADGVEVAVDEDGFRAFVDVSVTAWAAAGLGGDAIRKHFADPERLRLPHVGVVIARGPDGAPAATALAMLSHGIGGIYWVGTVPAARGRGLGGVVTLAAARWAFHRGARFVCLQASPQGEPVYRRLGFREVTRYPWFVARREGRAEGR
jgi:GNAT superfamily N-acetyltransferase